MTSPAEIALYWMDAVTRRDKTALLDCSHPAIEIHSPAGVGIGHRILSDWFDAMPMRITVKRIEEQAPNRVMVEHRIEWLGSDGFVEHILDNAAWIETRDGKVHSYRRVDEDVNRHSF